MKSLSSVTLSGLTEKRALERFESDGPNELPTSSGKSPFAIALEVLSEPMILLLIATGSVYSFLGDFKEAIALAAGIGLIIAIELYQENKTERTLQALRDLSSPRALVIRDGYARRIAGRDVVREDLLILSEGDRVPADALVLTAIDLAADESLLTGESVSVRKSVWDRTSTMPPPGGDDLPGVYSGTLIVRGRGTAVVTATGPRTEIGRIGKLLSQVEPERAALKKAVDELVRLVAIFAFVSCIAIAILVGWRTGEILQGVLSGLALAISLVPEEFPVVLTIFMALGAWRIAQRQVLTRKVTAIEALGAATVLCTDKTGTLTANKMAVRETYPQEQSRATLSIAALTTADRTVDPIDTAVRVSAGVSHGPDAVKEYPLSADLLVAGRAYQEDGHYRIAAKGAPEAIFKLCQRNGLEQGPAVAASMAAQGLRVLGVAEAKRFQHPLPESLRAVEFTFAGLIGFEDPLRDSVKGAVAECRAAGVRVVMITGDYPATAQTIAEHAGLHNPRSCITGPELNAMSDGELRHRIADTNVFARVMPSQKLRLVQALKSNHEVVAMTGDGVNDAPALKASDIGIAMGSRGTDVAREAASLVLLNDDFSSIVDAIRLGRRIYDNLRNAFTYILAIHVGIAGLAVIPVLAGLPMVLLPLHIVFLELVIDPASCIAFEAEREDSGTMKRPPRPPSGKLFDRPMFRTAVLQGIGLFAVSIVTFIAALQWKQGEFHARAIAFVTLVLSNLSLIWADRHRRNHLIEAIWTPNTPLWVITAGTLIALATVIYSPVTQELFRFAPLHLIDLLISGCAAFVALLWFEIVKRCGPLPAK